MTKYEVVYNKFLIFDIWKNFLYKTRYNYIKYIHYVTNLKYSIISVSHVTKFVTSFLKVKLATLAVIPKPSH